MKGSLLILKRSYRLANFFLLSIKQQPTPVDQALLIMEALRPHSDTQHSVGRLWTSDQQDFYLITDDTTDIHARGGIRTYSPSNRVATDPHLRPRGL